MTQRAKIHTKEVPIITSEANVHITTFPRGETGRAAMLVFEFSPAILSGDTPGIMFRCAVSAGRAEAFANALVRGKDSIKQAIAEGRGTVEGKNYARLQVDFNDSVNGSGVFIFINEHECENLANAIFEAVAYARSRPLLV